MNYGGGAIDHRVAGLLDGTLPSVDPVATSISTIASQGILGVMLVIVGFVAWSKDRELKAERLARIEDAKSYSTLALGLQAQVIDAVNKVSDVLQEMKKWVRTPAAGGGFSPHGGDHHP